jgi:hypothetical protein
MNPDFVALERPSDGWVGSKRPRKTDHLYRVWTHSLPFFQSKPGCLIHRIRSGTTYIRGESYSHSSVNYYCGNLGQISDTPQRYRHTRLLKASDITEELKPLLCQRCQTAGKNRRGRKPPDE